jgi:diaminopimelate epimerase
VQVPGGRLTITPSAVASRLTGPAVLVAAGELDERWLGVPAAAGSAIG